MTTITLAKEIESSLVPLGHDGVWTPARQQYAIHTEARYIAVSKEQFFAAVGDMDAIVSSRSRGETKGSGDCSKFSTRYSGQIELGRIYTGNSYDANGQVSTSYVLDVGFAQKMATVLQLHAEASPVLAAEETLPKPENTQMSKKTNEIVVTYLTNACGEDTGHGTLELSESDLNKVAFDEGPGVLLPYIVEIEGKAYVSANLEIAHKDEIWRGDDEDFMTLEETQAYCAKANDFLAGRISHGALMLPLEEDDPGRIIIRVAIPLENLRDAQHTSQLLSDIFGDLAQAPLEVPQERHNS